MQNKSISQARIMQQIKNLQKQKLTYLAAGPLQDDIFTWHFTFQGPQNTDFHYGIYHGQIFLPFQYPFKPPDIVFMNNNGRFQTNTKICLTITQYHPQQWNSAWTVRTMLQAVISLFNQQIQGVGYVKSNPEAKRFLAKQSHNFSCPKCGLIKDILKPRQNQIKVEVQTQKKVESNNLETQKIQNILEQQVIKLNMMSKQQRKRRQSEQEIQYQKLKKQIEKKDHKQKCHKRQSQFQSPNHQRKKVHQKRNQRIYEYQKTLSHQIQIAKDEYYQALKSVKWLDD